MIPIYFSAIGDRPGKRAQLAQAIIFAIYIPDDRTKNCLPIDMLSVHISRSMPELCAEEVRHAYLDLAISLQ